MVFAIVTFVIQVIFFLITSFVMNGMTPELLITLFIFSIIVCLITLYPLFYNISYVLNGGPKVGMVFSIISMGIGIINVVMLWANAF